MDDMNLKMLNMKSYMEKARNRDAQGAKSIFTYVKEQKDAIAGFQNTPNGNVSISIKMDREAKDGPAFIGTTTHVAPQPNAYIPAPTVQEGVIAIVHPTHRVLEFIRTQQIATPVLAVTNEVSGDGDFQWTAEGALKPYVDFEFKTETVQAEKIAAFSKVSRESLTDISFMQSETERIISDKYERRLASEVLNGDGTVAAGASGKSILGLTH
jgi:HK97 family phage major capsid protein